MKMFCRSCGIHFPADFPKTLTPECTFWEDHDGQDLSEKNKKAFWDWLFEMPCDQIFIEQHMGSNINFIFNKPDPSSDFKNVIPNYEKMTEEEQQMAQRHYFLGQKNAQVIIVQKKPFLERLLAFFGITLKEKNV